MGKRFTVPFLGGLEVEAVDPPDPNDPLSWVQVKTTEGKQLFIKKGDLLSSLPPEPPPGYYLSARGVVVRRRPENRDWEALVGSPAIIPWAWLHENGHLPLVRLVPIPMEPGELDYKGGLFRIHNNEAIAVESCSGHTNYLYPTGALAYGRQIIAEAIKLGAKVE